MKKEILEILCCPTCKGELTLKVDKENEEEILQGTLICERCTVTYPIEDGIPNLLPKK